MKIVITGSSGRVGRAIYHALAGNHQLIGIDRSPFSTTKIVGDFVDMELLVRTMRGADVVIHTAALHAPHVGIIPDTEFHRINVDGTRLILEAARIVGLQRIVFTSTTALFGQTMDRGVTPWVTDETIPKPRSIYHQTKLAAESLLQEAANKSLNIRVIRMSRSFPDQADVMALYRLCRGVDIRDVADAHVAVLTNAGPFYQSYIISGETPFLPEDCHLLATNLKEVIQKRAPALLAAFQKRGWSLPSSIDRVYDSSLAKSNLGWTPKYGFEEVLAQLDRRSLEVLPVHIRHNHLEE